VSASWAREHKVVVDCGQVAFLGRDSRLWQCVTHNVFIEMQRGFVADVSGIAYDALKMAVEHVLGKIKEGKKLSTEDILVLYLGTIVSDLREIRADIARLDSRIDETNKRIDAVQTTLLEIQKLLIELVKSRR